MKKKPLVYPRSIAVAVIAIFLAACGGGSVDTNPPAKVPANSDSGGTGSNSESSASSSSDSGTPPPDSGSDTTPGLTLNSASYSIAVTGAPYDWSKQNVASLAKAGDNFFYRFGAAPEMILREVPGNGFAIAWSDSDSRTIKVTKVDSTFANSSTDVYSVAPGKLGPHKYTGDDLDTDGKVCTGPEVNGLKDTPCDVLAGFEVIDANNYYLSYSDYSKRWETAPADSNYKTRGGQLVVKKNNGSIAFQDAMVDPSNDKVDLPISTEGALVSPLQMSTMRMVYDGQYIAYILGLESYLGGKFHEAGFLRYIQDGSTPSLVPKETAGYKSNSWMASHDLDQRAARVDRTKSGSGFVFAGLGDTYPRSVFAYDGRTGSRINVFSIPGSLGANSTYTILGGLDVQEGSTVALSFVSKYVSNSTSDNSANELNVAVALVSLSDFPAIAKAQNSNASDLSKIKFVYLTKLGAGTLAVDPKLAALGKDKFLVAWREVSSTATTTANAVPKYAVIDVDGNVLIPATAMPAGFQFHRTDDFLAASDGNVYWAVGGGADKLVVNALKLAQ